MRVLREGAAVQREGEVVSILSSVLRKRGGRNALDFDAQQGRLREDRRDLRKQRPLNGRVVEGLAERRDDSKRFLEDEGVIRFEGVVDERHD